MITLLTLRKSDKIGYTLSAQTDTSISDMIAILSRVDTYAIDVYPIIGRSLYKYRKNRLWLERPIDEQNLTRAQDLMCLEDGFPNNSMYTMLYAGSPWRYMAFQGPRGYRRLLVELGTTISRVEALIDADPTKRSVTSLDFYDDQLERIFGFDGIETTLLGNTVVCTRDGDSF